MVKFKIDFTIDAETLFRMASQFLPISDVHVEELPSAPPPAPKAIAHIAKRGKYDFRKSENYKKANSLKMKKYWQSPKGMARRAALKGKMNEEPERS